MAFAEMLQEPDAPWMHVIINLGQSDLLNANYYAVDPRPYLDLQGCIFRAIRDLLGQHGIPYRCIWTRECGPRFSRQHTHALLFAPPALSAELAALIRRIGGLHGRDVFIASNGSRGINTTAGRAGVLRDLFECVSPKAADQGVSAWQALGIEARRGKGCTILGKRSGTSESLSRAARTAAGWKELRTLLELRAVMPTKEEARRERNRIYKRRRRGARKEAIRLPQPSSMPLPPRNPDPFDGGDLADDFFE